MSYLRHKIVTAAIFAALAIGFFAGFAIARQPHMWNAKHNLEQARNQLNMAEPDKAGHRVNALNLVNQAIGEVDAGIRAGR